MLIYKQAIKAVLGGSVVSHYGDIWVMFAWSDSKQGFKHWHQIAYGHKKLSKRSRQYLNRLLNS